MKIIRSESIKPEPDKVRAIIMDIAERTIITNYDGNLMFPGGKLDNSESSREAIVREVREGTGIDLAGDISDDRLFTLQVDVDNYPERDGSVVSKTIRVDYYRVVLPEIKLSDQALTEKEILGKFAIRLVRFNDLPRIIETHKTENERWSYFKEEIKMAISELSCAVVKLELEDV